MNKYPHLNACTSEFHTSEMQSGRAKLFLTCKGFTVTQPKLCWTLVLSIIGYETTKTPDNTVMAVNSYLGEQHPDQIALMILKYCKHVLSKRACHLSLSICIRRQERAFCSTNTSTLEQTNRYKRTNRRNIDVRSAPSVLECSVIE